MGSTLAAEARWGPGAYCVKPRWQGRLPMYYRHAGSNVADLCWDLTLHEDNLRSFSVGSEVSVYYCLERSNPPFRCIIILFVVHPPRGLGCCHCLRHERDLPVRCRPLCISSERTSVGSGFGGRHRKWNHIGAGDHSSNPILVRTHSSHPLRFRR